MQGCGECVPASQRVGYEGVKVELVVSANGVKD